MFYNCRLKETKKVTRFENTCGPYSCLTINPAH